MRLPLGSYALFVAMVFASPAFAVDLDDDVTPDTQEHIASEPDNAKSNEVEATFPDEAAAIREAVARHVRHANTRDLDGYMGDFLKERIRYYDAEVAYAKRAMALADLQIQIQHISFTKLSRTAATIHTRQISTYTDDHGNPVRHDAIISYRWIKDANDGVWRIAFTERQHSK